jgi:SAM-dependent methyltransferase
MNQTQTNQSFKDKWENSRTDFYEDLLNPASDITKWLLNRNGFADFEKVGQFLSTKKRVLDAGCGNGRVLNLFATLSDVELVGVDFSSAHVAKENLKARKNVSVHEGNLLADLSFLGNFDFIYCQEVLHHTGDARKGFSNLVKILSPNGEIAVYVYKKKAPVREFVDDYIRDRIKDLSYEDAVRACADITELGKVLSELNVKVNAPAVPVLGIKAGEYDIQRFLYHHFVKCFWNSGLSRKENDVINYDWYHPEDCTRHTIEEVANWFIEEKLKVTRLHEDEYGITAWGKR